MRKTVAWLMPLVMLLFLCACGAAQEKAAPARATAEPAVEREETEFPPRSGLEDGQEEPASGEPCGEPVELFPADGYERTLEGYKAYAIDAIEQDAYAPEDIVETTVADIKTASDGRDLCFSILIQHGRILTYEEFMS